MAHFDLKMLYPDQHVAFGGSVKITRTTNGKRESEIDHLMAMAVLIAPAAIHCRNIL